MPDKLITLDNLGTFKSKIENEIDKKATRFISLSSTTLTSDLRNEILSDDYFVIIKYGNLYYYERAHIPNGYKEFEVSSIAYDGMFNEIAIDGYKMTVYYDSLTVSLTNRNAYAIKDKALPTNIAGKDNNGTNVAKGKVLTTDGSGNTSWEDKIPTITISLSQVVSQNPLQIHLTAEQTTIWENNNIIYININALQMRGGIAIYDEGLDGFHICSYFGGGVDANITFQYYYDDPQDTELVVGVSIGSISSFQTDGTDATQGKVLTADGNGGTDWITPSGGGSTDVQINGTSIVSSDVANIATEGTYNASTNKIATIADTIQVKAFANTATLADIYNGGKPFIMYYNSYDYYFVKLKQNSSTYSFEFENVNGAERFEGSSVSGATTLATIIDHQGSYYAPYALASTLGNYVLSSSVVGTVSNANTNPVTSGGVYTAIAGIGSSKGLNYLTTAPSADNTDGLKFVVLSSEPATKYDGYIYIITGSNS